MRMSLPRRLFIGSAAKNAQIRGKKRSAQNRHAPELQALENRTLLSITVTLGGGGPTPGSGTPGAPVTIFAVGAVPGHVQVYQASNRRVLLDFLPYGSSYNGPVSVAIGDLNSDGFPDLVTGALVGNPQVKVFDGRAIVNGTFNTAFPDANLITSFFAYGLQFNVGVTVAIGDVNSDGFPDIITGASVGNPHVKIFNGRAIATHTFNTSFPDGNTIASFFAYAVQFNIGVNVASGDINGDSSAEVVTGPTRGNPHVKVYDGHAFASGSFSNGSPDASLLTQFFAYPSLQDIGVFVGVGDVNGDHFRDIITGSTVSPLVKIYTGAAISNHTFSSSAPDASLITQFDAFDPSSNTGVTVGASDVQSNGILDILTGRTRGPAVYRIFQHTASGINPPPFFEQNLPTLQTPVYVGG